MIEQFMPLNGNTRFIFFSGKGGVGKSTMSCATAVWNARQGRKTLLVTTDPAPNLSDIFEQQIGAEVTAVKSVENLFAIEINPDQASDEYRERIVEPMRVLLDEKHISIIKEQMNSPCVEEVAAFDKFISFMDDHLYDVVVFDTAPTGHTVRLLQLPTEWSSEISRGGATCVGPSSSLKQSQLNYDKAISYLQDTSRTTFVFVMKPELISLNETVRSSAELAKLDIPTSALIINGFLPDEAISEDRFREVKRKEEGIIAQAEEIFKIPKIHFPLLNREVKGVSDITAVGSAIFEKNEEAISSLRLNPTLSENTIEFLACPGDKTTILAKMLPGGNETKYIFFTGKGGTGKSTFASSTAIFLAEKGIRTLIVTTDPASHLDELFGQLVEHEPSLVNGFDNLYIARIDQVLALDEYRKRILDSVAGKDEATIKSVEEDLYSPCAEEMAAFEKFMNYFDNTDYSVVIFDTAPTGHALRLLELPADWKGFIDLGTLTRETSQETKDKYDRIIDTMKNPEKSVFGFVMYPEYTPMIEALRAANDLKEQVGINAGFIAVNYVLSKDIADNPFFVSRRSQQNYYLIKIRELFLLPMAIAPLCEYEPQGVEQLKQFAVQVYGTSTTLNN